MIFFLLRSKRKIDTPPKTANVPKSSLHALSIEVPALDRFLSSEALLKILYNNRYLQ